MIKDMLKIYMKINHMYYILIKIKEPSHLNYFCEKFIF